MAPLGSRSLSRATGTVWSCPKTSNWHCVSVNGWKCRISLRSPALFWISVIPYSTACIKMRTVMELWGGLSSFSGLEMEELLKAVNTVEYEVHGFIYQLDDLVYIKERDFPLHWLSIM
ncbi:neuromedin-S isoform X3 [Corvus moneduloides]|uniref:neuromedin-S isoform X3 n=1 Tax=Corvus moneduloides TaxID=1196302 RepID=UPI00136313EB|nr:neuromedin-S isoform X3 [Corvus moneduloides]